MSEAMIWRGRIFNLPTIIFCPVIDEFLAMSINACAVSSKSVYHAEARQKNKPSHSPISNP